MLCSGAQVKATDELRLAALASATQSQATCETATHETPLPDGEFEPVRMDVQYHVLEQAAARIHAREAKREERRSKSAKREAATAAFRSQLASHDLQLRELLRGLKGYVCDWEVAERLDKDRAEWSWLYEAWYHDDDETMALHHRLLHQHMGFRW